MGQFTRPGIGQTIISGSQSPWSPWRKLRCFAPWHRGSKIPTCRLAVFHGVQWFNMLKTLFFQDVLQLANGQLWGCFRSCFMGGWPQHWDNDCMVRLWWMIPFGIIWHIGQNCDPKYDDLSLNQPWPILGQLTSSSSPRPRIKSNGPRLTKADREWSYIIWRVQFFPESSYILSLNGTKKMLKRG